MEQIEEVPPWLKEQPESSRTLLKAEPDRGLAGTVWVGNAECGQSPSYAAFLSVQMARCYNPGELVFHFCEEENANVRLEIQNKRVRYTLRGNEIQIESAVGNFEGTIQGDVITGYLSNWSDRPGFTVTRVPK